MSTVAAGSLTTEATWERFAEATLTRQPEAGQMGRELAEGTDAERAYAVFAREAGS